MGPPSQSQYRAGDMNGYYNALDFSLSMHQTGYGLTGLNGDQDLMGGSTILAAYATTALLGAIGGDVFTPGETQTTPTRYSGLGRSETVGEPNSIYEQVNTNGNLRSRSGYNENGHRDYRIDFDHPHGEIKGVHEHFFELNYLNQQTAPEAIVPYRPGVGR